MQFQANKDHSSSHASLRKYSFLRYHKNPTPSLSGERDTQLPPITWRQCLTGKEIVSHVLGTLSLCMGQILSFHSKVLEKPDLYPSLANQWGLNGEGDGLWKCWVIDLTAESHSLAVQGWLLYPPPPNVCFLPDWWEILRLMAGAHWAVILLGWVGRQYGSGEWSY